MRTTHRIAATAAAALTALATLAGCGDTTDGTPEPPAVHDPAGDLDDARERMLADAFVATLDDRGITYPSRDAVVDTGRRVCDAYADGAGMFDLIDLVRADGYPTGDASYLAGAAVGALCLGRAGAEV